MHVKENIVHQSVEPDDVVVGAKIDYYKIRAIPAWFVTRDGTWQDKLRITQMYFLRNLNSSYSS